MSQQINENTPIIFVGDLHGNINLTRRVIDTYEPTHRLCFMGDYLDSFTFNIADQRATITEVLYHIQSHPHSVALIGNHDLRYLDMTRDNVPGFNQTLYFALLQVQPELKKYLRAYWYIPAHDILATHAGLSEILWREYGFTKTNLAAKLDSWLADPRSAAYWCGPGRFGDHPYGGIFWSDYHSEHVPVPDLIQIVGHTPCIAYDHPATWQKGTDFNVDCVKSALLEYDPQTRKFKELRWDL